MRLTMSIGRFDASPGGRKPQWKVRASTIASVLLVMLISALIPFAGVRAVEPGNEHFERTWARPDRPVAEGLASRTWMWGPEATTEVMMEEYAEATGGQRAVQYFDKSRMEITDPDADPNSPWYVTNGLLVVELVTGDMQVGHNTFIERFPAEVPVAGDPDDADGPTYATFAGLLDAPAHPVGEPVGEILDREGNLGHDPQVEALGVTSAVIDQVTGHAIAAPFWNFMNSSGTVYEDGQYLTAPLFENPYFATGRPITEPYGARVKVAGTLRLVIVQCFERRCLTYTPGNPEGFIVEAGNVGQHYYHWRYEVTAAPAADFGDAPDGGPTGYPTQFPQTGSFPTLSATGGAHTLDLSQATLGPTASAEIDANDPNDPDGVMNLVNQDADDGVTGLTTAITQIPPPANLSVQVTGGSGGDFFLNVLIDLDMDGAWGGTAAGGEPEWVVQNHPLTVAAGEEQVVTPPAFAFANGNRLPDGAWMRVALTSEPVSADDWDGSGSFAAGEIEDHVIVLPEVDGKGVPILRPDCTPPGGGPYRFAPGQLVLGFQCTVTNLHPTAAGNFTWEMIGPLSGSVAVAPLESVAPVAIGAGGVAIVNPPFVATRGELPSTWRFRVTAVDPPTEVFPGGVVLGYPESSDTIIEFTGDAGPQKTAGQEVVGPGQYIDYTIIVPANPELEAPAEGQIVDPINADFFIGMQDPVISDLTCNTGECFYDPETNNIVWFGTFNPGELVVMSFSILVPEGLLPDEYPEEYLNCIHGFDGYQEFSDVCASTQVELSGE